MSILKRVAIVVAVVVVVLAGAMGALMASVFGGSVPRTDVALPDGTQPIVDGFVNAYAIPLSDPSTVALIDCGTDPEAKVIRAALDAHHWTVAAIFITHGHSDHIAGCQAFPGVPVYALQVEVDAIEGRAGFHGPMTKFADPKDMGARVSNVVSDGDVVDVGGVAFHVYAVPGHTAGSAMYRVRDTLFFGDAATGKTPDHVEGPVWVFSDDAAQGRASLARLGTRLAAEPPPKMFAFSHSGALGADLDKLQGLH